MSALSGGNKLAERLKQLKESFSKGSKVHVGFLEGSTCGISNDMPAPEIAFLLETGAPKAGIPPRPFFHHMVANNSGEWGTTLIKFLKHNDYDPTLALKGVGLVMGEQLQKSITDTTDPPNTDAVAKAKGFNKPLEHSKNMKRAIEYEVDGERSLVNESA